MKHRELCEEAAKWLLKQNKINLVSFELGWSNGVFDAIGITLPDKNVIDPRICIIEVKRTRADLLQDLNNKKMLKYEKHGTHVYLALGPEFSSSILDELPKLGLPNHWGVPLFTKEGFISIRNAKVIKKASQTELNRLTKKIALSYMYRVLSPHSPLELKD